jgi:hypothetical protein
MKEDRGDMTTTGMTEERTDSRTTATASMATIGRAGTQTTTKAEATMAPIAGTSEAKEASQTHATLENKAVLVNRLQANPAPMTTTTTERET